MSDRKPWRWAPTVEELRERMARQAALAEAFDMTADGFLAPPFDAVPAFGVSWAGYRIEMFGRLRPDGPAIGEPAPWPLWQSLDPDGRARLTIELRRVWIHVDDSPATIVWTWRPGRASVAIENLEAEARPDVVTRLFRGRQLFAGIQRGGRPRTTRLITIEDLIAATAGLVQPGRRPPRRREAASALHVSEGVVENTHRGAGLTWQDVLDLARKAISGGS